MGSRVSFAGPRPRSAPLCSSRLSHGGGRGGEWAGDSTIPVDVSGEDLVAAEGAQMTPLPIDSPLWTLAFLLASWGWDWVVLAVIQEILR